MTSFENEFLGPFIYNSSIVCLNTSRLMNYNKANFSPSSSHQGELMRNLVTSRNNVQHSIPAPNHEDLVQCPQDTEDDMGKHLECFWNISFAVMIITAILGNSGVLYIVISMFPGSEKDILAQFDGFNQKPQ